MGGWRALTLFRPSVLAELQEVGPQEGALQAANLPLRGDMAAFEAIERLQKFDWLIQKLHTLRTSLQAEPGLTDLQQLHALQILQRNAGFNGSSVGESEEEEKMELCKLEGEEEEDIVDTEEELEEEDGEDQSLPLALTTTLPEVSLEQGADPATTTATIANTADNDNMEPMDKLDNELEEQSEEREEERVPEREPSPHHVPAGPRFPTSHLFPPLPFDSLLPLADDAELKVGAGLFGKFVKSLLPSPRDYWTRQTVTSDQPEATTHPATTL